MPNTYTLIEKITVGAAGASSITFTSIPQTYTDLVISLSYRAEVAGPTDGNISFNSSTSNFSWKSVLGTGSSAVSANNTTNNALGQVQGANATASTFANLQIYIPNYAGSTNKSFSVEYVTENNATLAYAGMVAGLWSNTSAITSIGISLASGNIAQYSTFYLYGIAKEGVSPSPSSAPYATGGDSIVFDGTYWIHTFRSSGTFTPKKGLTCDYLVVAGGGGGYVQGGGAGGMRCTVTATGGGGSLESAVALTNGTAYTVTVGAGGVQGNSGTTGSNSSIAGTGLTTITSTGGGGTSAGGLNGMNGGSGGGAFNFGTAGSGTANQGYAGGACPTGNAGGGGGGAGAVGTAGSGSSGGNGGNGVATSITGSSVTYAGGGAGYGAGSSGTAGTGGGGTAGSASPTSDGGANLGGGGGGNNAGNGGKGGSGIVIVRYAA